MDTLDILDKLVVIINTVGIVGVLAWGWIEERKRADRLEERIMNDWQRQSDREMSEPIPHRHDPD